MKLKFIIAPIVLSLSPNEVFGVDNNRQLFEPEQLNSDKQICISETEARDEIISSAFNEVMQTLVVYWHNVCIPYAKVNELCAELRKSMSDWWLLIPNSNEFSTPKQKKEFLIKKAIDNYG